MYRHRTPIKFYTLKSLAHTARCYHANGNLIIICICRFNLAFTYYGIALMTTEIFQGMDENAGSCEGMTGSNFTQTTL